ncbi:MAG: ABC transporter substrate-binding protein [Spirochaetes bacterium]|nr:ABC transporter substrate-binding protein [Spirochaetota bacterium]
MKKCVLAFALIASVMMFMAGCSRDGGQVAAENTVRFYGWGGSPAVNGWIDNVLAPSFYERYGLNLVRVPMDISDILNMLLAQRMGGVSSGDIDVMWINGENFYFALNANLIYGPIVDRVANYTVYLNPDDPDLHFDFGTPIGGMSVPFGRAQLVFVGDTAVLDSFPSSAAELLDLARQFPGMITYTAPPDFTGSAFVRNIIYEIVGFDAINNAPVDEAAIYEVIRPALDFLVELNPYLWQQGQTFPTSTAALRQMFVDGLILFTISYTPLHAAQGIQDGSFPDTVMTFVFDNGNIGNTHYVAIPFNAPNVEGALSLISHIISAEMQITKYDARNWGDLPVFDVERLTAQQRAMLESIDNGGGILPADVLLAHRVPEVAAAKIPIIDRLWIEHVLGN